MNTLSERFWAWYERHYVLNLMLAAGLFILQLIHLYWLTTHVVLQRITGVSYFTPGPLYQTLLVMVDYTEIPALLFASLLYLHDLRTRFRWKGVFFLIFLNSQWLHLFWITDEFVIQQFLRNVEGTILPIWLAWVAISIDYLELPVIFDTIRRAIMTLQETDWRKKLSRASRFYLWRF